MSFQGCPLLDDIEFIIIKAYLYIHIIDTKI